MKREKRGSTDEDSTSSSMCVHACIIPLVLANQVRVHPLPVSLVTVDVLFLFLFLFLFFFVLVFHRLSFMGSNHVAEQKGHTGFLTFATRPHESLITAMATKQEEEEEDDDDEAEGENGK